GRCSDRRSLRSAADTQSRHDSWLLFRMVSADTAAALLFLETRSDQWPAADVLCGTGGLGTAV
ncbi:MAG: hypothetical protein ACKPHU_07170, partial [Planctomycetaceae bacterium]